MTEDAISRTEVDKLIDELARAISDERCCISRGRSTATIMEDILRLPSIQPKEPCEDAISRNNAITSICQWGTTLERVGKLVLTVAEVKQTCADMLRELPSVRPKAKTGYLLRENVFQNGIEESWMKCSECGFEHALNIPNNYCPNCGSRMISETN